ncbi:poly(A)-specific ribonuclease PARN-like [Schistocerca gregaria]|uniref:poly(A)-specific ribonuclease PARN-like n=1 Tax=Schistocerca gregaria TaxID=7010 RepID=UPI00211EAF5E|nr:poly(A)-specific ribonuclease PARN-like [Schistocerca gregaria]
MEVTDNNFQDVLPTFKKCLGKCDFLSVDLEFSGLKSYQTGQDFFDSPQKYYGKLRESASRYIPMQFGICTFKWDKYKESYECNIFNFFILPRDARSSRHIASQEIGCFLFLRKHQFDFNKWLDKGISWLSHADFESILPGVTYKKNDRNGEKNVNLKPGDKEWLDTIYSKIDRWLEMTESTRPRCPLVLTQNIVPDSYKSFLIYQNVRKKYPNLEVKPLYLKSQNGSKCIEIQESADIQATARYIDDSTVADYIGSVDRKCPDPIEKLEQEIGFRHVIDLMVDSKKPIVGHNMFLDIAHIYHSFFEPLPEDPDEFAHSFHEKFPAVLDLKVLSNYHPYFCVNPAPNTQLSCLYEEALRAIPEALRPQFFSSYNTQNAYIDFLQAKGNNGAQVTNDQSVQENEDQKALNYHEAAFDAFITGVTYLYLSTMISRNLSFQTEKLDNPDDMKNVVDCPVLKSDIDEASKSNEKTKLNIYFPSANEGPDSFSSTTSAKLVHGSNLEHPILPTHPIFRSILNSIYLYFACAVFNLDRPHTLFDKKNIFKISGLNNAIKTPHILSQFKEFGHCRVHWINNDSVYVEFFADLSSKDRKNIIKASKWKIQNCYDSEQEELRGEMEEMQKQKKVSRKRPLETVSDLYDAEDRKEHRKMFKKKSAFPECILI